MLTNDQLATLAQPFTPDVIEFKPGATNQGKTRALALAYVDLRRYFDRLDAAAPGEWSDDYEVLSGGTIVKCQLTIGGVTRCDVGEKDENDANTTTSAAAQAFKRACAKFGLGRHLYDLPQTWVDYDQANRRIPDEALQRLRASLAPAAPATRVTRTPQESRNGTHATDTSNDAKKPATALPRASVETSNRPQWRNPDEAKAWAMSMGAFDHSRHCDNAYDKARREYTASTTTPSASGMYDAWYVDVVRRLAERHDATHPDTQPIFA